MYFHSYTKVLFCQNFQSMTRMTKEISCLSIHPTMPWCLMIYAHHNNSAEQTKNHQESSLVIDNYLKIFLVSRQAQVLVWASPPLTTSPSHCAQWTGQCGFRVMHLMTWTPPFNTVSLDTHVHVVNLTRPLRLWYLLASACRRTLTWPSQKYVSRGQALLDFRVCKCADTHPFRDPAWTWHAGHRQTHGHEFC